MDEAKMICKSEQRRRLARGRRNAHGKFDFNGIDYIEIPDTKNQTELAVHLFHPLTGKLDPANIVITGGKRIRDIRASHVVIGNESSLVVRVDRSGDFSDYTLSLVDVEKGKPTTKPLKGFDPRYAHAGFNFKAGCPSDLDCNNQSVCLPVKRDEPEINYLAKDYSSFRQLILDRLALIIPDWQERHVPDIGIALVEILAYVGDYLSYYQDAVATEAYLDTARLRTSIRRHARLVDYRMHEGCNARALVTVAAEADFQTTAEGQADDIRLADIYFATGGDNGGEIVFEPMERDRPAQFFAAHNAICFYTWGDEECCLPKGATCATLKDDWLPVEHTPTPGQQKPNDDNTTPLPSILRVHETEEPQPRKLHLEVGNILIFEEVKGPGTGNPSDADPTHRWAVRLTKVTAGLDLLITTEDGRPTPIVEVQWAPEDALPFPFCISTRRPAPHCDMMSCISVAHGNVVVVDHGRTVDPCEEIGQVGRDRTLGECSCEGSAIDIAYAPKEFTAILNQAPLTFCGQFRPTLPASRLMDQDPRQALPHIVLKGLPGVCAETGTANSPVSRGVAHSDDQQWKWAPKYDLLASTSRDRNFVVEIDNDGVAHIRFGDGECGRMPDACLIFTACYRIGNGSIGNVGADTITTMRFRKTKVDGVTFTPRNPLPARGGTDPEPIAEVKLYAPGDFRKVLERAITAADYAEIVQRNTRVQQGHGVLNWTGSWYEAQVAIDPRGSEEVPGNLLRKIERGLYRYRRIGHDLKATQARYVPLDVELTICVLPQYLRAHVQAALLEVLGNGVLPDGRLGFFHPDNLTFGEGILLNKLVSTAQKVQGVRSVQVNKLQRRFIFPQGVVDKTALLSGVLALGPMEIAQLDNDPSFPEHGTLKLNMKGGR